MTTQFAAGRPQLPALAVYNTGSGNVMGGNSSYYFWLQARNRTGFNNESASFSLTVPNNCTLGCVIPGISYLASEDWHEFLIYANTADNFSTARIVGSYKALAANQQTRTTLGSNTPLSSDPKQLVLSENYHLNFSSTVSNPSALPAVPLQGMRRFVTSLSRTYRYDADSTATTNGDTVLTATTGRWLYNGSSNLIENPVSLTTSTNGCDQNINLVSGNPDLLLATYDVSGNTGIPIRYYLKSASNTTITKGTRILLSIRVDDIDVTDDFNELFNIVVYGKVQTSNYALVTTNFLSAGSVVPYNHFTQNIILEDDLLADEYLLLSVQPEFSATDVDTNITPSVALSLYPYFAENTATYGDSNLTVGDLIFSESNKRLCIPYGLTDVKALSGSGCVNLYTWRLVDEDTVTGFTTNTSNQPIVITRTGEVLRSAVTGTRLKRAAVDTTVGYSTPCAFSSTVTIASGDVIAYNITIEKTGGFNTISDLCSDLLIRGLGGQALLSTNRVAIIVRVGSVYKQFIVTIDPTLTSISGIIADWSAGTTVTLPTIEAYDKNLFKPESATITGQTAGSSGIPAGSCAVAYSFYYNGSYVSGISHSELDGCIPTESLPASQIRLRSQYWADDTNTLATLKALVYPYRTNNQQRRCNATNLYYTYLASDTRTADDLYVVQPDDNQGRWVHELFQVDRNQRFNAQYVKRNIKTFNSTLIFDLSLGNHDITLTGNTSVSFTNFEDGGCWILFVVQGGSGGYSVTWTGVDWGLFGAPVLSTTVGKFDIITLISRGAKLYGLKSPGFTV